MEIRLPPNHGGEGDAIPISKQPEDNVRPDDTEILPTNMFPKYYVRRKNKLHERTTQSPSLEEEVTSQQDDPCEEEILPIALRKGTRACVKPLSHSIVNVLDYEKISPQYKSFLTALNSTIIPHIVEEALHYPH